MTLSEKNDENACLPLLNNFGHVEFFYMMFCSIVKEGIAVDKSAAY